MYFESRGFSASTGFADIGCLRKSSRMTLKDLAEKQLEEMTSAKMVD